MVYLKVCCQGLCFLQASGVANDVDIIVSRYPKGRRLLYIAGTIEQLGGHEGCVGLDAKGGDEKISRDSLGAIVDLDDCLGALLRCPGYPAVDEHLDFEVLDLLLGCGADASLGLRREGEFFVNEECDVLETVIGTETVS